MCDIFISRTRADNDNEIERVRAREYPLAALKRAARMSCAVEKQIGGSVPFVWERRVVGGKVWKWNWKQSAAARKPCSPLAAAHLDS